MVNEVKVYKKNAPNGKVTVYLGRRDFVDDTLVTEPIDGVVICDEDYLKGRKIFTAVTVTYRIGREEDEVMGVNFSKELQLSCQEVSRNVEGLKATPVQERLINKLGGNVVPFFATIPDNAPCSVQLHPGIEETAKPLGVIYELKVYVAENSSEKPHRRNSVTLAVRKVQFCPVERFTRQPSTMVSKGFTFSSGKVTMEVTLDKEMYYHGQQVCPTLAITNNSKKTVKNLHCSVVQHIEITMTNSHFSREVAGFDTKEGCPITPSGHYQKAFTLVPLALNMARSGIALDGKVKDGDANLASSTLVNAGSGGDALGIVVSYSVRVRLNCGALGGELTADLPFKLMHPKPMESKVHNFKRDDDALQFEEFSRLRRGQSVDDL